MQRPRQDPNTHCGGTLVQKLLPSPIMGGEGTPSCKGNQSVQFHHLAIHGHKCSFTHPNVNYCKPFQLLGEKQGKVGIMFSILQGLDFYWEGQQSFL